MNKQYEIAECDTLPGCGITALTLRRPTRVEMLNFVREGRPSAGVPGAVCIGNCIYPDV